MAGLTSGDRSTNGALEGQEERIRPVSRADDDGRARADREQVLSDTDQTAADSDQTAADSDQATADGDQAAADSDQAASDRDQAASDRDLVHGGDAGVHEFTRDLRGLGAQRRQHLAQERLEAAAARDAVAHARDLAAVARDRLAAQRDRELAVSDDVWAEGRGVAGKNIVRRTAENRRRAAAERAAAAEVRARAAVDREQAARDRQQAARDRLQALADREALAHQLAIAETDELTGARTRAAGLVELDHEIDRARRAQALLAVAYVDVVGLKAVNDTHGHAAGDALLRRAVGAIRSHLRSYDHIVRLGGDEFLCVMSGATLQEAQRRFDAIQTTLAADPDRCEIKVGFAELSPQDGPAELIERADVQLLNGRARGAPVAKTPDSTPPT